MMRGTALSPLGPAWVHAVARVAVPSPAADSAWATLCGWEPAEPAAGRPFEPRSLDACPDCREMVGSGELPVLVHPEGVIVGV